MKGRERGRVKVEERKGKGRVNGRKRGGLTVEKREG